MLATTYVMLGILLLLSTFWLTTPKITAFKAWTLILLLCTTVLTSSITPSVQSPASEIVTASAILLGALGGSTPASYFVGLLKAHPANEEPAGQQLTGQLGSLAVNAHLTKPHTKTEVAGGGRLIGIFERLALSLSLAASQTSTLAVIVAVKGLARYPEIKAGQLASEKFIVGTFASLLWATGCTMIAINLR